MVERGSTGEYLASVAGGETVRAFVPAPLPPAPSLRFTPERRRLLERATLALGRLDSITLLLPDPEIFLYSYVRREAVLSSQIEGTQSSLSDLLQFELSEAPGVPFDDVVEVSNYVRALEHGLARLADGLPLCNRLLREMHEILLSRGRGSGKRPGEFRRSQNWIGGTRPGNAFFVPPPPQVVESCMADLERFIHDPKQPYPTLVKAALAHVQFETVHPFLDGNGRLGRLLISFMLHHEGMLSRPLLYLSLYFKTHRQAYYECLNQVRTRGDWEGWIDFFLEGVEQTALDAVETARRLVALMRQDEQRIHGLGRRAGTALRVHRKLCHRPLQSIKEVVHELELSYPAVSNSLQALTELGIVHEITGRQRNRIYAYQAFIDVLNEGAQPL